MTREQLAIELAAAEKAGKITPEDRDEVEKFADFLTALGEAKKDPNWAGKTQGEFYDAFYGKEA